MSHQSRTQEVFFFDEVAGREWPTLADNGNGDDDEEEKEDEAEGIGLNAGGDSGMLSCAYVFSSTCFCSSPPSAPLLGAGGSGEDGEEKEKLSRSSCSAEVCAGWELSAASSEGADKSSPSLSERDGR